MGSRNRVLNTDDEGRREVMAALANLRAHDGNRRPAYLVARRLAKPTTAAQVLAVANADGATFDVSGTDVALTDDGYREAKHHPQPRQLAPS